MQKIKTTIKIVLTKSLLKLNLLMERWANLQIAVVSQNGRVFPNSLLSLLRNSRLESDKDTKNLNHSEQYLSDFVSESPYKKGVVRGLFGAFLDISGYIGLGLNDKVFVSSVGLCIETERGVSYCWLKVSEIIENRPEDSKLTFLKTFHGLTCYIELQSNTNNTIKIFSDLSPSASEPFISVIRVSLVLKINPDSAEISGPSGRYLKLGDTERAYLGRSGSAKLLFGKNALTFRPWQKITSSQVDMDLGGLIFNLDWSADHPKIKKKNEYEEYENASNTNLRAKQKISSELELIITDSNRPFVVMMPVPHAFHSTHCFTIHGCHNDIRAIEGIYFGSGGLLAKQIPTTLSCFYTNKNEIKNCFDKNLCKVEEESLSFAICNSESTKELIKKLYRSNKVEIALHCFDDSSYTSEEICMAINEIQVELGNISTYVDHIWYKPDYVAGPVDNCVNARGTDSIGKTLLSKGIRYWWNCAAEYLKEDGCESGVRLAFRQDFSDISKPYVTFFYDNEYSLSHELKDSPVWWTTVNSWYPKQNNGHEDKLKLQDAINNWSYFINHCYITFAGKDNHSWQYDGEKSALTQEFSDYLSFIQQQIQSKNLWVPTLREAAEYWEKVQNVKFEIVCSESGTWDLLVTSPEAIQGVTFYLPENYFAVYHNTTHVKFLNKFNRCWIVLDLQPGCSLKISMQRKDDFADGYFDKMTSYKVIMSDKKELI